jgi:cell shape-determining protein MreC
LASGCIVGNCYLCEMPVFEDEAKYNRHSGEFKHDYCKVEKELQLENKQLRRRLEEYEQWLKG